MLVASLTKFGLLLNYNKEESKEAQNNTGQTKADGKIVTSSIVR